MFRKYVYVCVDGDKVMIRSGWGDVDTVSSYSYAYAYALAFLSDFDCLKLDR